MRRQRHHTTARDLSYRTYGYYPDGQLSWFKKAAIRGGSALENRAGDAYYYQGDGVLVFTYGEAANPGTYSANADTNPTSNLPGAVRVCQYGYDAAGNRTTDNGTGSLTPPVLLLQKLYRPWPACRRAISVCTRAMSSGVVGA